MAQSSPHDELPRWPGKPGLAIQDQALARGGFGMALERFKAGFGATRCFRQIPPFPHTRKLAPTALSFHRLPMPKAGVGVFDRRSAG